VYVCVCVCVCVPKIVRGLTGGERSRKCSLLFLFFCHSFVCARAPKKKKKVEKDFAFFFFVNLSCVRARKKE